LNGIGTQSWEMCRRGDKYGNTEHHMSTMLKNYAAFLFLILISSSCNYQEPPVSAPAPPLHDPLSPEAVVKAFCNFDARGKRLSRSLSIEEKTFYRNLVRWNEEPIGDTVVLISSCKLGTIRRLQDTAQVTVIYEVKGSYSPEAINIFEKIEKVEFMVSQTEAGWKINKPVILAHVYPEKMIVNLEERSKHEGDTEKKAKFQKDANLLKNLKYFSLKKKEVL
jgi:hypothetical protein